MTLRFEPYVRKKSYPHLVGADSALWDRFVRLFPNFFSKVVYDLHLGEGVVAPPGLEEKFQALAKLLTQKRVDVVGISDSNLTIVEVKTYAGTTAVGQLLLYRYLFQKEHPDLYVSQLLLISDVLQPDMKDFCKENGIQAVELGYLL